MRFPAFARIRRALACGALALATAACTRPATTGSTPPRSTLVAIFAHPDDETLVAPVLARYAREGHRVFLVIATDGRLGAAGHAKIPTGDSLATVRANETRCSAHALGIEPPILLRFPDAGLADFTGWPGQRLDTLSTRIDSLLHALRPAAVVTWGPEGGYGHADHRLTGNAVTAAMQSDELSTIPLFYSAFPATRTTTAPPWYGQKIHPVNPRFITRTVAITDADEQAAFRAIACHWSQASASEQAENRAALHHLWQGQVTFQQWRGGPTRASLF